MFILRTQKEQCCAGELDGPGWSVSWKALRHELGVEGVERRGGRMAVMVPTNFALSLSLSVSVSMMLCERHTLFRSEQKMLVHALTKAAATAKASPPTWRPWPRRSVSGLHTSPGLKWRAAAGQPSESKRSFAPGP
jgi:hypothetical protein